MFIDIYKMQEIESLVDTEAMVYAAALEYAEQGFSIIPIRPNEKTLPKSKVGINYYSASNKIKTVEDWFEPGIGKFRGWNIGLVTGMTGKIFVIDADKKGKIDGIQQLVNLQESFIEFEPHPYQETPGGGEHHVFRWVEGCTSSTSKLDTAIDTRGGSLNRPGGHIVVFPSTVNGRMYRWTEGGHVQNPPLWVLNMMGANVKALASGDVSVSCLVSGSPADPNGNGLGNENVTDEDIEQLLPVEQIQEMLDAIDPNDLTYSEWLWVGQAINTQYPDTIGLDMWDKWSRQGTRYKNGECSIRWNGFDPSGEIRISTLYYLARQHGMATKASEVETEIIEDLNKEYALVLIGNKIRVIKEHPIDITHSWMPSVDIISKEDFKTLLENRKLPGLTPTGRPTEKTWAEIWLASENRREYPKGMGFYPAGDTPIGAYNTFRGWPIAPGGGDCSAFVDHIIDVICDGNKDLGDFVLDWLADIFQDPGEPKGTSVVLRGKEGAGKGSVYQCIAPLIGTHATQLIDESHLTSNFNAHLMETLLLFADEITWGGNKRSAGKLKGLVTEKFIVGERKGIDAVKYQNYMRMMISSNDEWVIPAGSNSRRWLVLDVSDKMIGNTDYFNRLFNETKANLPALMNFMLNRKVDQAALRIAPVTSALKQQRIMSLNAIDSVSAWWRGKLEDGDIGEIPNEGVADMESDIVWPELVSRMAVYQDYENWCTNTRSKLVYKTLFYKKMEEYGLKKVRSSKPDKNGLRKTLYKLPNLTKARRCFETAT